MKKIITLLILFPYSLFGQEKVWTLQECINSGFVNNAGIRLAEIDISIANSNLKSTQLNFLPTLNGNVSHGYNWGQTIDPFTNSFATTQVRYNTFYLASSVTLFSGLQNHYEKKINHINLAVNLINEQIEKRNVLIDVLGAYLQVQLNNEIVHLKQKHWLFSHRAIRSKFRLPKAIFFQSA